jgi:ribosomal protein L15
MNLMFYEHQQPLGMAPPKAGTTCAYLSWSTPTVRLSHLPGKLGSEPFMRCITGVSVGTRLILRR